MKKKTVERVFILVLALMIAALSAGCGESRFKVMERFKLNKDTYALEKWVRQPDMDKGDQLAYGLCFLMVGKEAPVTFVLGSSNMSSAIGVTLESGEKTLSANGINFISTDEVSGYGLRVIFTFMLPKDAELPKKAELFDVNKKDNKALLDLTGLEVG